MGLDGGFGGLSRTLSSAFIHLNGNDTVYLVNGVIVVARA
jgi:hypothetical protein